MRFGAYVDDEKGVLGVRVKSCGHIFAKNGRRISRPHGRNDWLLFYVAKGGETFYLDSAEIEATVGSFILFKPFEPQEHVYLGDKTAEFYYVHFTVDENVNFTELKSSKIYNTKASAAICELFEKLLDEVQLKLPCYEKLCVFKLLEIVSLLERRVINRSNPHSRYINKIAYVVQEMHRDCGSNCSLEEYAGMCCMDKFHFLRVFKDITGLSPVAYKNKIRIEHAKELLEDTAVPVAEIGTSLGYDSPSYFCDAFKKQTGLSPLQFRHRAIKGL